MLFAFEKTSGISLICKLVPVLYREYGYVELESHLLSWALCSWVHVTKILIFLNILYIMDYNFKENARNGKSISKIPKWPGWNPWH